MIIMTTEAEMREIIQDAIYEHESNVIDTDIFEDVGMMTNDVGFVIRTWDGSEFRVTIKQSK